MIVILVVSGDGRIGRHVRSVLGSQGWWVTTAADREEALRASADHQPALVIVDSEVDGAYELVRTFGSKNGGPGVLLLDAAEVEADDFGAFEAGADQILSKPPRAQSLLEAAERVMSLPHQSSGTGSLNLGHKLSSEDIFGDLLSELEETKEAAEPSREEPGPAPEAVLGADAEVDADIQGVADYGGEAVGRERVDLDLEEREDEGADEGFDEALAVEPAVEPELVEPVGPPAEQRAEPPAESVALIETVPASAESAGPETEFVPGPAEPAETDEPDEADELDESEPVEPDEADERDGPDEPDDLDEPTEPEEEIAVEVSSAVEVSTVGEPDSALAASIGETEPEADKRERARVRDVDPSVEQLVAQLRPSAEPVSSEESLEPPSEYAPEEIPYLDEVTGAVAPESERPEELVALTEPPVPTEAESSIEVGTGQATDPQDGPVVEPAASTEDGGEESDSEVAGAAPALIGPDSEAEEARFGQYRLDERIAVGGMAEVWRASMLGMEGFRKTVAIKKILPHLAENDEFVTMFIEEAKLAARLTHENLVEIYDLGRIGASYFIAMEYVDGRDLRSLFNRLRQRSEQIPIGLALLVAAEVARGLEYAHTRQDGKGNPMGLVHRDVSPRNVLIGHDGRVRLCDFGVAKAVSSVIQTEIGALKGKLQYMSPEQASGKPVDARSDIYSLGSVLYEMITGRRLYEADNEISLLDAVRAGSFDDPREHCPGLPQEVRRILVKALAKRPSARYQAAGVLGEDLKTLLRSLDPVPSEQTLSGFVSELFSESPTAVDVGDAAFESASASAAQPSDASTRSFVAVASSPRSKAVRFWWGVVAGLLAAGLVAGAIKLILG